MKKSNKSVWIMLIVVVGIIAIIIILLNTGSKTETTDSAESIKDQANDKALEHIQSLSSSRNIPLTSSNPLQNTQLGKYVNNNVVNNGFLNPVGSVVQSTFSGGQTTTAGKIINIASGGVTQSVKKLFGF
jgi:hypothetical protein